MSGTAAPTGCYKCGRPGHWSRDCPSDPIQKPNPNSDENPYVPSNFKSSTNSKSFPEEKQEKPKKIPRTRPKLTPQLLLSDDGLGYVLRHFPRNFKYRGRGHEVSDLGHLIKMYKEWHSHLIPYYSFDQFVHKVEKVAASKQVKRCIMELRDRVAQGEDPTKLHEPPGVHDGPDEEPGPSKPPEAVNVDPPDLQEDDPFFKGRNIDDIQQDILNEFYEKATEEPSENVHMDAVADMNHDDNRIEVQNLPANEGIELTEVQNQSRNGAKEPIKSQMSEEQRARMEASRLKALEKAAVRARSLQAK